MSASPSVYVLQANEGWVTDVYVSDFLAGTSLPIAKTPQDADIVWLLASWCWNHISPDILASKPVICTVHHIVPSKFDVNAFMMRDQFVNVYFVYTQETASIIRQHSNKPIVRVAHWIDSSRWPITPRDEARKRVGITPDEFVIGSFQRDTEGSDLTSPKLEKGPDILCDLLERMSAHKKITLLLGGWRREYVLNRTKGLGLRILYRTMPPQEVIKDMYASCDLYLCTSRHEGGPMCILESAVMRVPIMSTNVGMAPDVLHPTQIFDPYTWDFTMPSEDAISYSHSRALERDPVTMIRAYDGIFRQIFSYMAERGL
jgi:glycosyltransferase involved in cell wall biosynthesis